MNKSNSHKPIVHYTGKATIFTEYDKTIRAHLIPINHKNHLEGHSVENGRMATTSKIICHDEASGLIETMNTIYMPESQMEKT